MLPNTNFLISGLHYESISDVVLENVTRLKASKQISSPSTLPLSRYLSASAYLGLDIDVDKMQQELFETHFLININFNLFIKEKDRSATYIDMHKIHVETR